MKVKFYNLISKCNYYLDLCNLLILKRYKLTMNEGIHFFLRSKRIGKVSDIDIFKEVIIDDIYEVEELELQFNTIVDIGGHIGCFAYLMSKRAKIIYSFEPENVNYELLKINVEQCSLTNVIPIKKAVLNSKKNVGLRISKNNTGGHSIYGKSQKELFVECVSIQDIFRSYDIKRLNLLKIDAEGAEYDIIMQTPIELLEKIDYIIMEIHITKNIIHGYCEKDIIKKLNDCNFDLKVLRTIYYSSEGTFKIVKAINKNIL